MKEYRGIGASEGIISSPIIVFRHEAAAAAVVQRMNFETAMNKFYEGRRLLRDELIFMARQAEEKFGLDNAGIYEGYAEILMDDEIEELVKEYIREGSAPDLAALKALEKQANELESLKEGINRERCFDLMDMGRRLAAFVSGSNQFPVPVIDKPCILVTDDLSPFETIQLNQNLILGLTMDRGGSTGHVAILARSLGIPCVVGLENASRHVQNGMICALDGDSGSFIIEPDEETLVCFRRMEETRKQKLSVLVKNALEPVCTKDGTAVLICANVSSPEEAERTEIMGADGVGLFRTEFFYMDNKNLPSEQDQFRAYRRALSALGDKPLTIRTLDLGGDKMHPVFNLEKEDNPFLGYRGIRFSLDRPEIFKPQIRAILRAAAFGRVEIMFPMVVSPDEFRLGRSIVEECQKELAAEGIEAGKPPVGIMVETPAAALMAGEFAAICDFFSIGTNDLTQYTLAADRNNSRLLKLQNPLNPAVLRLMALACREALKAKIPVGICGELAADPNAIPLLIGFGISKLSVSASRIPAIKAKIRSLDSSRCRSLAQKAMELENTEAIYGLLSQKGIYD